MIDVKIVNSNIQIDPFEIEAISNLHVKEMAGTLNSVRGAETIADLYRRLLSNGGQVVLACKGSMIVGVMSFTSDYSKVASLRAAFSKPRSWFRVILKIGIFQLLHELLDSYQVSRKVKRARYQIYYVTTIFVEANSQNTGIASMMFSYIKNLSINEGRSIFVDTKKENLRAIDFYKSQGMFEFEKTVSSVIFQFRSE